MNNKSDNNQVATKGDIQRIEKSLNNFATKDDLKKYATKTDLKITERNLRGEILRVEEKVEIIQEGQEDIKVTLSQLQNTLDGFVGRVDELTTENVVGAQQARILRVDVDDHERRIRKIESTKL